MITMLPRTCPSVSLRALVAKAAARAAAAVRRVGHGPFWIAVDQAAHSAYTANNTDSTVSVISTAICKSVRRAGCGQRTAAVRVGYRPWAVTVDQRCTPSTS
jgi:DNA-binding beta-propeller fold protein YncE